ncbi:MAG: 23S rRNA (uracil(1939)-C(5))-methyltransferase RlmD, partial [Lachnospiraceae bacterium]|nr:23S rRNA (uracil(1939)-C(5))-methyltransferase RlmD [Lachnospiraceae bacterium]
MRKNGEFRSGEIFSGRNCSDERCTGENLKNRIPLKKNDEFVLEIEDISVDGAGVGKKDGIIVFVKDTVIGDRVRVRVVKPKKTYAFARLMEILTPSPDRVKPVCGYYRQCGGCQIQALSYEKQLEFKQHKVESNLCRIGGFEQIPMEPIIGMEDPFHYRNKSQFPVGTDKNGKIIAGFYAERSHRIIPNRDCALGVPVNRDILDIVIAYMERYHVSAYDEGTGQGLIRHVLIRYGFCTGEVMVCLIINGTNQPHKEKIPNGMEQPHEKKLPNGTEQPHEKKLLNGTDLLYEKELPHQKDLIRELTALPGMTSISVNINTARNNVILGAETRLLWGQLFITDYIGNIKYQISPVSFFQVNPVQTETLYGLVLEYADLHGTETVWDLYCGIGTISLFLAQRARQVCGVEIVPQAIEDARRNAALNGITNAEFFVGKAEEVLPGFYESEALAGRQACADVIVVDPPRKGCDGRLLRTILRMAPERIVYVSCESKSLARDLKVLCEGGYRLERVRAVDNFCQTVHVETVCLLGNHRLPKPDAT